MKTKSSNTLFIVDDDPDDRQVILDAFLETNNLIDYVFMENAEELMSALENSTPQDLPALILLDLNLPGMMGLQALKEIKTNKNFNHIPTVILTTSILHADLLKSYELGANCFLQKPSSYGELVEITGSVLKLWFRNNSVT